MNNNVLKYLFGKKIILYTFALLKIGKTNFHTPYNVYDPFYVDFNNFACHKPV